jgi:hypothetical protein
MVNVEGGSEESLGAVSYRGRKRQVFVLPETGTTLMQFEINGPNQVTFGEVAATCTLTRLGAPSSSATPAAGSVRPAARTTAVRGESILAEKTPYRCPAGELIFVDNCNFGSPDVPECWTDRYDLPKVNNRVQVVMANRAELASLARLRPSYT